MSTQLEEARRRTALTAGGAHFFLSHPEVYSCDANFNVLSSHVLLSGKPLDDAKAWQEAFDAVGKNLCDRPTPREEAPTETKEEPWPYAWCRPVRTYADVTNYPGAEYRALWFDQKSGKPTEKQRIFRELCNNIIEKENGRRAKERV